LHGSRRDFQEMLTASPDKAAGGPQKKGSEPILDDKTSGWFGSHTFLFTLVSRFPQEQHRGLGELISGQGASRPSRKKSVVTYVCHGSILTMDNAISVPI
jgi:hypothetical protein